MAKKYAFFSQVAHNAVALISLCLAIIALSYDTWRNERTERNRNTRVAAFEVLKQLGELQQVVNYSRYEPNSPLGNPMLGWQHIAMIGDLTKLLPPPAEEEAQPLIELWKSRFHEIQKEEAASDQISEAIDRSRKAVLDVLYHVN